MLKKLIAIGGIILMAFSLAGCFGRSYVLGKNPKLEEITSIYVGGGGMEYSSSWSYSARRTRTEGEYELQRVWWDDRLNEMRDITVSISAYEFDKILASVEGLKYVKYNPPKNVMDGDSQSARVFWMKSPSGSYRIDFGERGMGNLLYALKEAWDGNAYKANEPVDLTHIMYFSMNYGPTDIYNGDHRYSAELDEDTGVVLLSYLVPGEEEPKEISVDSSFMDDIAAILREYGADRWDGFSGEDNWVMDGSGFGLYIESEGGSVSANGRENFPEGFWDCWSKISELFGSVFEE